MGHILELMNINKCLSIQGRSMCKYNAYGYTQIGVNMSEHLTI